MTIEQTDKQTNLCIELRYVQLIIAVCFNLNTFNVHSQLISSAQASNAEISAALRSNLFKMLLTIEIKFTALEIVQEILLQRILFHCCPE